MNENDIAALAMFCVKRFNPCGILDIEDLHQIAMTRIWQMLEKLGDRRLSVSLIIENVCSELARHLQRERRRSKGKYELLDAVALDKEPEAESEPEHPDLTTILYNLTLAEQQLLQWRFWEGLKYREIGERLGITNQAAHMRLKTILNKIMAKME